MADKIRQKMIYIPVWIDLKFWHSLNIKMKYQDLHSSMDRFEVDNIQNNLKEDFNLHSSMDRFEE